MCSLLCLGQRCNCTFLSFSASPGLVWFSDPLVSWGTWLCTPGPTSFQVFSTAAQDLPILWFDNSNLWKPPIHPDHISSPLFVFRAICICISSNLYLYLYSEQFIVVFRVILICICIPSNLIIPICGSRWSIPIIFRVLAPTTGTRGHDLLHHWQLGLGASLVRDHSYITSIVDSITLASFFSITFKSWGPTLLESFSKT